MACDLKTKLLISCCADGEATPEEAVRAKAHLHNCSECRKMVESWAEHRQMLEWAYALELPELSSVEFPDGVIEKETHVPRPERVARTWSQLLSRRSMAWVGALTVALIIGFALHHLISLPPLLREGQAMASDVRPRSARMNDHITLTLGPQTKIERIDDTSVRLLRGRVAASVRGGSGLRILTGRLEVLDQGTRFHVGTGPRLDYVIVEEGSVVVSKGEAKRRVRAGNLLMAQDNGEFSTGALPQVSSDNQVLSGPPELEDDVFVPQTDDNLTMREGMHALSSRFPKLPRGIGSVGATLLQNDREYYHTLVAVDGLRDGLSDRAVEFAQSATGGGIGSSQWEIPVCFLRISGVLTTPELPADMYYVRLVTKDGKIVWRFSGADLSQADYPLVFGEISDDQRTSTSSTGSFGAINVAYDTVYADDEISRFISLQLMDWPGRLKPALRLKIGGVAASKGRKDEREMMALATRQTSGVEGLDLQNGNANVLYLDPQRRYRMLVAWDGAAGRRLCRVSDLAKQGHGGSAILGVLSTDVSLQEPRVQAGTYLLKLVVSAPSRSPHLELASPDGQTVAAWGGPSHALTKARPQRDNGGGSSWSPESLPGYGTVNLGYSAEVSYKDAGADTIPVLFQVTGPPDDRSTRKITRITPTGEEVSRHTPTEVWAEGRILLQRP